MAGALVMGISGCATATPALRPRVEEVKGVLVLQHLPAAYAPAEGFCWRANVSSVEREEHVYSEDGCVPSGGVGRPKWLEPGEYIVEISRCAGAECNVERDPSQYLLVCDQGS